MGNKRLTEVKTRSSTPDDPQMEVGGFGGSPWGLREARPGEAREKSGGRLGGGLREAVGGVGDKIQSR